MSRPGDRWIGWTTTGYVALLALIAGTVSYLHMHPQARQANSMTVAANLAKRACAWSRHSARPVQANDQQHPHASGRPTSVLGSFAGACHAHSSAVRSWAGNGRVTSCRIGLCPVRTGYFSEGGRCANTVPFYPLWSAGSYYSWP